MYKNPVLAFDNTQKQLSFLVTNIEIDKKYSQKYYHVATMKVVFGTIIIFSYLKTSKQKILPHLGPTHQ